MLLDSNGFLCKICASAQLLIVTVIILIIIIIISIIIIITYLTRKMTIK
uniref:Uncharacterized protein n=1 Tax=Anguilla anguilla TaxID=7936 RepID=A0A0E9TNF3_ANGAN